MITTKKIDLPIKHNGDQFITLDVELEWFTVGQISEITEMQFELGGKWHNAMYLLEDTYYNEYIHKQLMMVE